MQFVTARLEGEELDIRRVCGTMYIIAFSIFDMILSRIKSKIAHVNFTRVTVFLRKIIFRF